MSKYSIKNFKDELKHLDSKELADLLIKLTRFKAESKEYLGFLLFQSHDIQSFVVQVKAEIDKEFLVINTDSPFYVKKSLRKILRKIRLYSRYTGQKENEIEWLLYFCRNLGSLDKSLMRNHQLQKIYNLQLETIAKKISTVHEDLQYDFRLELEELKEFLPKW